MLKLSQIAAVVATLDGAGSSRTADEFAARWGYPSARFRRSSASHVFALADPHGEVAAFLRFVPDNHQPVSRLAGIAAFMDTLVEHGAPVARPLRSLAGRWVESVQTEIGLMHATVVSAAPGTQIDTAALTMAQARAWGQALARTHQAAIFHDGTVLPAALDRITDAVAGIEADAHLAVALDILLERLRGLPTDGERFGAIHGDFELDNLTWTGDRPTAFDFDEATRSWYAADIASAVRDLAPVPARTPSAGEAPLFAALLAGYRQIRPLSEDDLHHLPLFTALHAAITLGQLHQALDAGTHPADPPWLTTLRLRLDSHANRLRLAVLHHT
jgi:Ser/Thr protein kinase RdoA (MazF antagonist)